MIRSSYLAAGLTLAVGFLVGSLPTGYLLARWTRGEDLTGIGSGSTGATNVLRGFGLGLAVVTLGIDAGKGAAVVLLSQLLGEFEPYLSAIGGVAVVAGHAFTPWLGWRGGKGVATGAGACLLLCPLPAVLAMGLFLALVGLTRRVSVGSISSAVALPWLSLAAGLPRATVIAATGIGVIVLVRHRENLRRLLSGNEPELGRIPFPRSRREG